MQGQSSDVASSGAVRAGVVRAGAAPLTALTDYPDDAIPGTKHAGLPVRALGSPDDATRLRRLLHDLDLLVQRLRSGDTAAASCAYDAPAARIAAEWCAAASGPILVRTTGLVSSANAVLIAGADGSVGAWILPLHRTGTRSLRAHDAVTAEQIVRLATALAALTNDRPAREAFCSWIWSGGAEGFEFDLESRGGTPGARQGLAVDTGVVDPAARDALARAADRPRAWLDAEIRALVSHPALADDHSVMRLARRLVVLAAGGLDASLLRRLAFLSAQSDESARGLLRACESQGLAEVLAATWVDMGSDLEPALRAFVAVAPASLLAATLNGVLRHGAEHPETLDGFCALLEGVGPSPFLDHLELDRLPVDQGRLLATAVLESESGSARLPALLARLPEMSTSILIEGVPEALLETLRPTLRSLLASTDTDVRERTARALLRSGAHGAMTLLAETIARTSGAAFAPEVVTELLDRLDSAGLDRSFSVDLARRRRTPTAIRLAVIDGIENDPDLARAISRFSLGALLDPAPVRTRLRALRQRWRTR